MKRLFFGGIHPPYNKEMSAGNETFQTVMPKRVVIPMCQHIGVPCTPLVKVGDTVKALIKDIQGEKIALSLKFEDSNPWITASDTYASASLTGRQGNSHNGKDNGGEWHGNTCMFLYKSKLNHLVSSHFLGFYKIVKFKEVE